jgi:hypothetical protein
MPPRASRERSGTTRLLGRVQSRQRPACRAYQRLDAQRPLRPRHADRRHQLSVTRNCRTSRRPLRELEAQGVVSRGMPEKGKKRSGGRGERCREFWLHPRSLLAHASGMTRGPGCRAPSRCQRLGPSGVHPLQVDHQPNHTVDNPSFARPKHFSSNS